jgi:quercetin dioxygenase-like cupin family protein
VLRGEVSVTRQAGTANARKGTIAAGQTSDLKPGDSILEVPGMAHTARNAGSQPVVIHLSSLFPAGAPPSSPAD